MGVMSDLGDSHRIVVSPQTKLWAALGLTALRQLVAEQGYYVMAQQTVTPHITVLTNIRRNMATITVKLVELTDTSVTFDFHVVDGSGHNISSSDHWSLSQYLHDTLGDDACIEEVNVNTTVNPAMRYRIRREALTG